MSRTRRLDEACGRRLRTTGRAIGLASLLASIALGACAGPIRVHDTITARRVDVVDDAGLVVARLGVDADGSAGLFLLGKDGRNRAALINDESQTALYLFDGDETIRVGVAQFAHGGGGVALHGDDSKGATVLYMNDGAGSLTFFDESGAKLHRIPEHDR